MEPLACGQWPNSCLSWWSASALVMHPETPMRSFLLALSSLLPLLAMPLAAAEIVAHRGASFDAPENTVASFRLAWEQGTDAAELDIHQSKDGKIVVIHDATTKRNIGVDRPVLEQTLEELRTLDAGSWKGAAWKGEKLPTLDEALATIPAGKRLFIEIKCSAAVLPELERVIQASGKKAAQLVIIAFDYDTIAQAKKRFPEIPAFWLAGYKVDKQTGKGTELEPLLAKAKAAGVDGLDLDFKFPIDAAFVAAAKAQGLQIHVWTVDDAETARRLAAAGVAGITTNRPGWLREQLK